MPINVMLTPVSLLPYINHNFLDNNQLATATIMFHSLPTVQDFSTFTQRDGSLEQQINRAELSTSHLPSDNFADSRKTPPESWASLSRQYYEVTFRLNLAEGSSPSLSCLALCKQQKEEATLGPSCISHWYADLLHYLLIIKYHIIIGDTIFL